MPHIAWAWEPELNMSPMVAFQVVGIADKVRAATRLSRAASRWFNQKATEVNASLQGWLEWAKQRELEESKKSEHE